MELILKVIDQNQQYEIAINSGEILLKALQDSDTPVHAPCGGKGTCKKCKVEIDGVGEVLACQTILDETLCKKGSNEIVVILPKQGVAKIQSGGIMPDFILNPLLQIRTDNFENPSIKDQTPDDQRVISQSGCSIPFHLLPQLSKCLRSNDFKLQYLVRKDINEITSFLNNKLVNSNNKINSNDKSSSNDKFDSNDKTSSSDAINAFDTTNSSDVANAFAAANTGDKASSSKFKFHGVSLDIGTTTVAAYLYDLRNGELIKTTSCLNPQRGYGADVISRIDYASQSKENLLQLQKAIGEKIVDLLFDLSDSILDIAVLSIAGNTTMMHLLCGIDPSAIASAPFIPVTISKQVKYAKELFSFFPSEINYNPICILLPSIAGYVGADVTAGILTCQMDTDHKSQLLIDIGTNGEIALSKAGKIVACSTAAGPAFEGANITCGIGGISGAIDKVFFKDNEIHITTILDEQPIGICGSGIVSAVAALLHARVIDETGRFEDDMDIIPSNLQDKIKKINNETLFIFTTDDEGNPLVYLTQKDIREVQNAKAAVCAGIRLLMEQQELKPENIDNVYIAGGFGNYLNVDDAFTIGLLPNELNGKAKMVGNTSGIGASLCLLNHDMLSRCEEIQKKTTYFELSSDKRFTDLYIDAMMFE